MHKFAINYIEFNFCNDRINNFHALCVQRHYIYVDKMHHDNEKNRYYQPIPSARFHRSQMLHF